jgi:ketopantoate reductase
MKGERVGLHQVWLTLGATHDKARRPGKIFSGEESVDRLLRVVADYGPPASGADDLVDRQHALVLSQADSEGTSLRHDLLNGRRMEVEALQGTLSRLGRETGVPTPWTDAAYAILEPWAAHNEAARRIQP